MKMSEIRIPKSKKGDEKKKDNQYKGSQYTTSIQKT